MINKPIVSINSGISAKKTLTPAFKSGFNFKMLPDGKVIDRCDMSNDQATKLINKIMKKVQGLTTIARHPSHVQLTRTKGGLVTNVTISEHAKFLAIDTKNGDKFFTRKSISADTPEQIDAFQALVSKVKNIS